MAAEGVFSSFAPSLWVVRGLNGEPHLPTGTRPWNFVALREFRRFHSSFVTIPWILETDAVMLLARRTRNTVTAGTRQHVLVRKALDACRRKTWLRHIYQ